MRGPLIGPSTQQDSYISTPPVLPQCNFCSREGFPSYRTNLLCSLFTNLAMTNGESYLEPRTVSFWIERYSLSDISLTELLSFSQFVTPFECDHEAHAGCFLWQIFHAFTITNEDDRILIPLDQISCIVCSASIHRYSLDRLRRRLTRNLSRFPVDIFHIEDSFARTIPPARPFCPAGLRGRHRHQFPALTFVPPQDSASPPAYWRYSRSTFDMPTSCSICGERVYVDRLRSIVSSQTLRTVRSDRDALLFSGMPDIFPHILEAHLFQPCWPFLCAEGLPLLFDDNINEPSCHWTHVGCLAQRLFQSSFSRLGLNSALRTY